MAIASYEISYLRKLLADISTTPIHSIDPTLLYGDNMGAIDTATNSDNTKRSRHIDIRYHITREALANGTLRLRYCRTSDMVADILAKPLPIVTHEKHRASMGLSNGTTVKVFFWDPHPLGGEYCLDLCFFRALRGSIFVFI